MIVLPVSEPSAKRSPVAASLYGAAIAGEQQRLQAGQRIAGRYEVVSPLGRGGMGAVYRVRDLELDEVVALKILHGDLVGSHEMLARFRREVKLARRVTHRNVARTFDIGEHEGERFLTMELIEGESLGTVLERAGRFEIARALETAQQMAGGMAAAHDAGVVHRDLKPENVSIAADGRVVLMDFGIARTDNGEDTRQTVGAMMGTPAYMAPEQVEGRDIDARADLYAFGAVLYEMLTGRIAWSGSSAYVVAMARLTSPPPDPRAHRPELSAEVAELVMRAMARDPTDRFADAHVLRRALQDLPAPVPTSPRTTPSGPLVERRPSMGAGAPALTPPDERWARKWGADGFREDIARQLVLMANRSPSYRRVLQELDALLASPAGGPVLDAFERVWKKRSFEGPFERPLLILAALRADARAEGPTHPLHAAIAVEEPNFCAVTMPAMQTALGPDRVGFWISVRSRRVQTNEVMRSIAWLWPATLAGAGKRQRDVVLFDVGASAGLNLVAEAVDVKWRRSTGEAIPIERDLAIRARTGFDPRPLDARRADDREWLKACIWPEQRARLAHLESALTAFRAAAPAPELVLLRASSVPARIESATKGRSRHLAIAYQTLVSSYVPEEERAAYESGMRTWVAAGARGERLWATLELKEIGRPELSCALDVHVAAGDGTVEIVRLGRTSYHPSTIDVAEGAEERLTKLLR